MERIVHDVTSYVALVLEAIAVLFVVSGAIESVVTIFRTQRLGHWATSLPLRRNKEIFIRFASWLVLGLEFELAADIVRSAVAPTWADIGQLAAIALIRTLLNYFLERDLEKYVDSHVPDVAPMPERKPLLLGSEPEPSR